MEETFLQVETVLNHNKLFKCGENSQKTVQNLSKKNNNNNLKIRNKKRVFTSSSCGKWIPLSVCDPE
jgi:hypothetical protein